MQSFADLCSRQRARCYIPDAQIPVDHTVDLRALRPIPADRRIAVLRIKGHALAQVMPVVPRRQLAGEQTTSYDHPGVQHEDPLLGLKVQIRIPEILRRFEKPGLMDQVWRELTVMILGPASQRVNQLIFAGRPLPSPAKTSHSSHQWYRDYYVELKIS